MNVVGSEYFDNVDVIVDFDYGEEYFGLEIFVCVVDDFVGVIVYIVDFGSNYIEVICIENKESVVLF